MTKLKNFMPKIIVQVFVILSFAFALTGCFGSGGTKNEIKIVYHLNGGETPWDNELDENGNYTFVRQGRDVENGVFLMQPNRETWFFEGWFLEDDFQTKYAPSMDIIPKKECDGRTLQLYAKWEDKIVIDSSSFKDYFVFSKNWNGGLNTSNAAVDWYIKPNTTNGYSNGKQYVFDPKKSQTIELEMHENSFVEKLELGSDANAYFEASGSASGFSGGQTVGSAMSSVYYTFPERSFEIYLLHNESFKITLDLDGGILGSSTELDFLGGDVLNYETLPVPAKEGYRFMGWKGSGHINGKPVIQNATVKAKFTKEHVLSYKLGFDDVALSVTLLDNDKFILPKLKKDEQEFFGWYYDAEFTQKVEYNGYSSDNEYIYPNLFIHKDTTLFARFEPIYKIVFDTNGGSTKETIEIANTKTPELGKMPTKQGLYFGGWFIDELFQEEYKEQPISKNINLYAKWLRGVNINRQNFEDYFDVKTTVERMDYKAPNGIIYQNSLKATLSISLKQEFMMYSFSFYSGYSGLNVAWHKEHSGTCNDIASNSNVFFLGNYLTDSFSLSNCTISYSSGGDQVLSKADGTYEFTFEKYEYSNSNLTESVDHIYVDYFGEGEIFFPENE